MNSHLVTENAGRPRDCDACGGVGTATCRFVTQAFDYGSDESAVTLKARIPVWTCSECEMSLADEAAEDLRHEAVCAHLGVLTPHQVRGIRERNCLSQAEFARITGFGEATVKRWETGAFIQNTSADKFLRLIQNPKVFEALVELPSSKGAQRRPHSGRSPLFRTEFTDEIRVRAQRFDLRRMSALG